MGFAIGFDYKSEDPGEELEDCVEDEKTIDAICDVIELHVPTVACFLPDFNRKGQNDRYGKRIEPRDYLEVVFGDALKHEMHDDVNE